MDLLEDFWPEIKHKQETKIIFKGTHTIYFTITYYAITQKPVIERTD